MKKEKFILNQKLLMGHVIAGSSVSVILARYVIFWKERGVAGFDASLVEGLFAVVLAVFSIPLGMIADKFGRKRVLLFGSLSSCLGFATYYFNHGIWDFIFSEILIGLGFAAIGCTAPALLVESVRLSGGDPADELKMTGDVKMAGYIGFAVGAPLGGFLFSIDERIPFMISALGPFIGFMLALFITETQSPASESRAKLGIREMFALRGRVFGGDYLSGLLWTSILLSGLLSAGQVLFQPFYQSLGHTAFSLGMVAGMGQILMILVTKKLSDSEGAAECRKMQSFSFLGLGSAYLLLASIENPIVVLGSWLIVLSRVYTETVLTAAISSASTDEERSTILGLRSFLDGVARVGVLLFTGWLSDLLGVRSVFLMVGALAFVLAGRAAMRARPDADVI